MTTESDAIAVEGANTVAAPGQPILLPEAPEALRPALGRGEAVAWSEPLNIRTYATGEPSKYPMYLDQRVYQGSSGKVYPLPFIEHVADTATMQAWQAVHLENEFVRLVVLPEIGGRIHIGYDKSTDYDFFYRNNVIKPALVGLAGPWISGGVEFNWPQHHRPATYLPVETTIEHGEDGSVTVWCGDHDPFARMAAQHGVRLHANSSVVELVVRLQNRTSERQTFLWWANVAARVHDQYQSFFPEDVRYVADHARRALTAFPSADRPYYGVDYPALASGDPGADRIDFYRNIPVPTSYMIVDSEQDFFGGYDHAAGAGFVHWAERRLSPGKKQWTWGNAPFGHAWDAQLTDDDGPYVELMAGVYTDNQPDFTWLLPGETKVFTQYWYPIPAIGPAHQATPDAAVHVDRDRGVRALFAVTSPHRDAVMQIVDGADVLARVVQNLEPGMPATLEWDSPLPAGACVELRDDSGRLLVRWTPTEASAEEPWVATEPPEAESIESVEELYLTGLHLSQYRHPTRSPLPYWNEALSRDPSDVRTNLALADQHYRAGRYEESLCRTRIALARLTRRNANPTDAEAFFLEGLALRRLGRTTEAQQAFGKAAWDGTWAAGAGFELAQTLAAEQHNRAALRVLDTLDPAVGHDPRRPALRAILLGRLGEADAADLVVRDALLADPLDATLRVLAGLPVSEDAGLLIDIALDFKKAGALQASLNILERAASAPATSAGNLAPIAHYIAATVAAAMGREEEAGRHRELARTLDRTWAFPFGLDQLDALVEALDAEPDDAVAHSLLGMLLFAHGRRAEAMQAWECAIDLGLEDAVLYRNAGLSAYNIGHDDSRAWRRYEQAIALAPTDSRLRYEQDQLAIRLGQTTRERLDRLDRFRDLVLQRDDFTIAFVRLLVAEGRAAEAYEMLLSRSFHPWEGGEGEAISAWDETLAALGLPIADPPASLGEGRARYVPPAAVRDDGETDYFATSLPELLLFHRETSDE
ncbi:MAG: DUF5107 domain-containing protein [Propionibacteriaceae bacterium]|nr:DUF5107 domain-containing protein [Propionibacteriaceae bacterium]